MLIKYSFSLFIAARAPEVVRHIGSGYLDIGVLVGHLHDGYGGLLQHLDALLLGDVLHHELALQRPQRQLLPLTWDNVHIPHKYGTILTTHCDF